jgi:GNAT superfamily N-acetyltransferase
MAGLVLLVRRVRAADSGALHAMAQRCSMRTVRNRMHWVAPASVLATHLAFVAADPRALVLVAQCGTDVIGCVEVVPSSDGRAEVAVLVEDRWQRQGIGQTLVTIAGGRARQAGQRLVASIEPGNRAAVRLARSLTDEFPERAAL